MNKLTAVKATNQDNQIINAAVDAIRSVLVRFTDKNINKDVAFVNPRCTLQISDSDERFTLHLDGNPTSPAVGRTLDEAMENLCENPDAAFLRRRAQTLLEKARELEAEADAMEGTAGTGIDSVTEKAQAATTVSDLLEPIFSVLREPFNGTSAAIQEELLKRAPETKTSPARISKAIARNMMFFQDMLGLQTKLLYGVTRYITHGTERTFQEAVNLTIKNMSAVEAGTKGGAE